MADRLIRAKQVHFTCSHLLVPRGFLYPYFLCKAKHTIVAPQKLPHAPNIPSWSEQNFPGKAPPRRRLKSSTGFVTGGPGRGGGRGKARRRSTHARTLTTLWRSYTLAPPRLFGFLSPSPASATYPLPLISSPSLSSPG